MLGLPSSEGPELPSWSKSSWVGEECVLQTLALGEGASNMVLGQSFTLTRMNVTCGKLVCSFEEMRSAGLLNHF